MKLMYPFAVLLLPLASIGCGPPEAPEQLQELANYVFQHTADEDPEELQAGLNNLDAWLKEDHEADPEEGYEINLLTEAAVKGLDDGTDELSEDLVGAAISHTSNNHNVADHAEVTTVVDWMDVVGDQYNFYDKTWEEGEDCIADRGCEWAEARAHSELVQLGVAINSKNHIQYRWVEIDSGWAFVHRSWLTEPPVLSGTLAAAVDPRAQYFLAVTLPRSDTVRLQAMWIDTKIVGVSVPKSSVVDGMSEQSELIEAWLDENR